MMAPGDAHFDVYRPDALVGQKLSYSFAIEPCTRRLVIAGQGAIYRIVTFSLALWFRLRLPRTPFLRSSALQSGLISLLSAGKESGRDALKAQLLSMQTLMLCFHGAP